MIYVNSETYFRFAHLVLDWQHHTDSFKSKDGGSKKNWKLCWRCEPWYWGWAGKRSFKDEIENDAKTWQRKWADVFGSTLPVSTRTWLGQLANRRSATLVKNVQSQVWTLNIQLNFLPTNSRIFANIEQGERYFRFRMLIKCSKSVLWTKLSTTTINHTSKIHYF